MEESAITLDLLPNSINSSASSSSASLDLDRPFDHTASSSPSDPPSPSRLNALAPAFVPRNSSTPSLSSLSAATTFHPVRNHFMYGRQLQVQYQSPFYGGVAQEVVVGAASDLDHASKHGGLTEEAAAQKIVNQVEFYFSDLNLATTDHLIKHMLKDPEGYVPISMVALFKKIKALISSHAQLAQVLRSSTKLIVSEDGKKVKRKISLTETDLEELQSRIVIAENLPEDHCHQNLLKIFSAVGSVKMIRTCLPPQSSNSGASSGSRTAKSDSMLYSNKFHAFVEYESVELSESAVVELNDDSWRNALKVRLLLKSTDFGYTRGKSGQAQGKKAGHESEHNAKGDGGFVLEVNEKLNEESRHHIDAKSNELAEDHGSDGQRRGRGRGRGKGHGQGRGRPQFHQNNGGGHLGAPISNMNRGSSVGNAPSNINCVGLGQPVFEQSAAAKQSSVPRMPDGTKGFSMGRGKTMAIITT